MAASMGEQAAESVCCLGEGSVCCGADGHHHSDFNVHAQELLKKINPNYDDPKITEKYSDEELIEKMFCNTLKLYVSQCNLRKSIKGLQKEHDALEKLCQELMRANEVDKQKIRDLETRAMPRRKRPRSGKSP